MTVRDIPEMRDRTHVFDDRIDAGRVLARMLTELRASDALLLAIPAGGVPVAVVVAEALALPLDVAVVSKIPFPWNPEAGFGAVAFDGTTKLNEGLIFDMGLMEPAISQGRERTLKKVQARVHALRGDRPLPSVTGRTVVLVDDGLASGMTMETAAEAVGQMRPQRLIVAVPTGHEAIVNRIAAKVDSVYCANIRGGWGFAVADAYKRWRDVDESEAAQALTAARGAEIGGPRT